MGNIRGIYPKCNRTKMDTLADMAKVNYLNIIILTESHLKPEIGDSEVRVNGFNVYRSDREGKSHGGVMISVRDSLNTRKVLERKNSQ